jgi:hypothetical protein
MDSEDMTTDNALPAILGGKPVRPQGPPDWPIADEAVLDALSAAYRDGSWGRYFGGHVEALEERLAAMHGVRHALTCGSGTFAVELALRALKVGPGDEVVMAAYDYGGNFLSVHSVCALPVLIDVAAETGTSLRIGWRRCPGRPRAPSLSRTCTADSCRCAKLWSCHVGTASRS